MRAKEDRLEGSGYRPRKRPKEVRTIIAKTGGALRMQKRALQSAAKSTKQLRKGTGGPLRMKK